MSSDMIYVKRPNGKIYKYENTHSKPANDVGYIDLTKRRCLKCDRQFKGSKFIRLCDYCKMRNNDLFTVNGQYY
jgi:hypothetical protein